MTDGFAPPVQHGIHLVVEDGQFVIAVSMRNPTDEPVNLTTMSTKLFSVTLKERTMTEEGTVVLWSPQMGAGQAVTNWTLDAGGRVTRQYRVPDSERARQRGRDFIEGRNRIVDAEIIVGPIHEQNDIDPDAYDKRVHYEQAVEPEEAGIVQVEVGFPAGRDYFTNVTRQYDLRTNPDRELDDELPEETMEAIDNQF